MVYKLADSRREEVWYALSDAFVDNEDNYAFIARKVVNIDYTELKKMFFEDIAPICGQDLHPLVAIPSVWACFNQEALIDDIKKCVYGTKNHLSVE
jgi:hypothetical protein